MPWVSYDHLFIGPARKGERRKEIPIAAFDLRSMSRGKPDWSAPVKLVLHPGSGTLADARGLHTDVWVTLLSIVTFSFWLVATWVVMRGNRRMRRLATLTAPAPVAWPRVSIVLAARNEGATLGAAVPTMLALDYPHLEVIAVNDRSEDDTGAVLDAIAIRQPRLRVDHIGELPPGWIGKTHALHHGAARATGAWTRSCACR